jgi:hypothetical protein
MELYCHAPSKERAGMQCGYFLGETPGRARLMVLSRTKADYKNLFPPPRIVKVCRSCKWYSIYEEQEPPETPQSRVAHQSRAANITS